MRVAEMEVGENPGDQSWQSRALERREPFFERQRENEKTGHSLGENIANHKCDEGLLSRIYNEPSKLNSK